MMLLQILLESVQFIFRLAIYIALPVIIIFVANFYIKDKFGKFVGFLTFACLFGIYFCLICAQITSPEVAQALEAIS